MSSLPSRYFSITASSCSAAASTSCARAAFGASAQLRRDLHQRRSLAAQLRVLEDERLHPDQVDDALVLLLAAQRQLDRHRRARPASRWMVRDRHLEVRAHPVHLVDEADARAPGTCPPAATPSRSAARRRSPPSNTATAPSSTRRERSTSMVKSTWPGVSMMLMRYFWSLPGPEGGDGGRGDGDAALALLHHPVRGGVAVVHLAHLVDGAGVEEDPLGGGGLAGVDVRHDADVAVALERVSRAMRTSSSETSERTHAG